MNARLLPEILTRRHDCAQVDLGLQTEGVLRYVWESRFGNILIEVRDERVYVNGQEVEPARPEART